MSTLLPDFCLNIRVSHSLKNLRTQIVEGPKSPGDWQQWLFLRSIAKSLWTKLDVWAGGGDVLSTIIISLRVQTYQSQPHF